MPNYNPYYYPTQNNAFPTQMNANPTQMNVGAQAQMPQMQNGGFVSVPNEEMVYSYPVAMGNCVTFKIEGKPIVMEKSVGFSQFESPKVKRFRLVEEDAETTKPQDGSRAISEIDKLKLDIEEIWGKLDEIENSKKPTPKRENKNGEA